mmetsp:Transcript_108649/g.307255  ORF Transcript_108649/g.307255 Transcript_108649/m.307255 type:complete len:200 (-) Transcript_108649:95-694(-)
MSNRRLAELLHHFRLPPHATQAELRKVYYQRAKLLHPDIAGQAKAAEFRRLKETYEEALKVMQNPHLDSTTSTSSSSADGPGTAWRRPEEAQWRGPKGEYWREGFRDSRGPRREQHVDFDPRAFRAGHSSHHRPDSHGYHYATSGSGSGPASPRGAPTLPPLTPAQRLRNILLVSGSVLAGSLFMSRMSRNTVANRTYT